MYRRQSDKQRKNFEQKRIPFPLKVSYRAPSGELLEERLFYDKNDPEREVSEEDLIETGWLLNCLKKQYFINILYELAGCAGNKSDTYNESVGWELNQYQKDAFIEMDKINRTTADSWEGVPWEGDGYRDLLVPHHKYLQFFTPDNNSPIVFRIKEISDLVLNQIIKYYGYETYIREKRCKPEAYETVLNDEAFQASLKTNDGRAVGDFPQAFFENALIVISKKYITHIYGDVTQALPEKHMYTRFSIHSLLDIVIRTELVSLINMVLKEFQPKITLKHFELTISYTSETKMVQIFKCLLQNLKNPECLGEVTNMLDREKNKFMANRDYHEDRISKISECKAIIEEQKQKVISQVISLGEWRPIRSKRFPLPMRLACRSLLLLAKTEQTRKIEESTISQKKKNKGVKSQKSKFQFVD